MRIIISPAKKMNVDVDSFMVQHLPQFLSEAEELYATLQAMSDTQLQSLWKCSDKLTKLNVERLKAMDLHNQLTPAILAYEGIQYRYMAPGVFEGGHLDYVQEHLRILSAFYGLLRPFDGVTPYRLEMQAKLSANGYKDLYAFWGSKLAAQLASETDCVLNLASKEYSRAVKQHLPSAVRFLTCTFGEFKDDKIIEKGTMCKMARGQMVRWLAEHAVTAPDDIKNFDELGYHFSETNSTHDQYIFIKEDA